MTESTVTQAAMSEVRAPIESIALATSSASFSVADAILSRVTEGGIVLWLLAAFSIVGVAIAGVKALQFARLQIWSRAWLGELWRDAASAPTAMQATLSRVRSHPSPVARVLEAVLAGRLTGAASEAELREEVERVADEQLGQLESGLRGLESIGTLAPLLGLLGTVLGMIRAFAQLERAGRAADPSILSGGIWEALLTTAVGLAVAIPALAALAWLDGQVDGVRRQLGDAATRALAAAAWRTGARTSERTAERTPERISEHTSERTSERTSEGTREGSREGARPGSVEASEKVAGKPGAGEPQHAI